MLIRWFLVELLLFFLHRFSPRFYASWSELRRITYGRYFYLINCRWRLYATGILSQLVYLEGCLCFSSFIIICHIRLFLSMAHLVRRDYNKRIKWHQNYFTHLPYMFIWYNEVCECYQIRWREKNNASVSSPTIRMVAELVSPCISVFFAAPSFKGKLVLFIKGSFVVALEKKIMSQVVTTFYKNRPIHAGGFIMRDLLAGQTFSHIFRLREIYLFRSRRSLSLQDYMQFVSSVCIRINCCCSAVSLGSSSWMV